jgi:hypothetical protein
MILVVLAELPEAAHQDKVMLAELLMAGQLMVLALEVAALERLVQMRQQM